jgi:hypothetical protein
MKPNSTDKDIDDFVKNLLMKKIMSKYDEKSKTDPNTLFQIKLLENIFKSMNNPDH